MQYTILGRTGLSVSRMGLGCGGPSRLGLAKGKSRENAVAVVRRALDLGVNFVDTAEAYGTEEAVGEALSGGRRDGVVVSTKVGVREKGELCSAARFGERVEGCLGRLQTDFVDVLHLHGVSAGDYEYAAQTLVPVMRALQEKGKIRFLGITEAFGPDPAHAMLRRSVRDDCWDVMMVGFSLLNQSARETVFEATQAKGIGVLDMFAVRRALSDPAKLRELMAGLSEQGLIAPGAFDPESPLGFLTEAGPNGNAPAASLPDAAYRFCRDEPGVHVVLSGTGSVAHLEENALSLDGPPLPGEITERLRSLFRGIDSVSGN